jgi:hypothetical protein
MGPDIGVAAVEIQENLAKIREFHPETPADHDLRVGIE